MSSEDYGVQSVVNSLNRTLQGYLEAQYHIRNLSLIEERRLLLEQTGAIYQEPYVESTPVYQLGEKYSSLSIPNAAKEILTKLASLEPGVGIFPNPYVHQSRALEAFLGQGQDLVVATGTGSGKTESFLMPVLGALAMEGKERPKTAALHGCRALLLYPMNALVNDQLGRIRKLFGDERVAAELAEGRGRTVRFGSYTGRTSYAGYRSSQKDSARIKPMFEEFYLPYLQKPHELAQLQERGRWPSKDLIAFYGADKVVNGVYKSGSKQGKPRTEHNWDQRLQTSDSDRELLTRHEMQSKCPDVLITNYSMLEYMLMRPIERDIFQQTREWLEKDPDSEFILVLDEAHMYRGTGGAEVALLIRRLQARLGIPRERMRCILTSASLGEGPEAERQVLEFARDLTGLHAASQRELVVVKGQRESREGQAPGKDFHGRILAAFDLRAFQEFEVEPTRAVEAVRVLGPKIGWPGFSGQTEDLKDYLYHALVGFGPAETLIQLVSGNAIAFADLARRLFPESEEMVQRKATEILLALVTFARRKRDGRVLAPARLHLFFRGLPALYACINPNCSARRADKGGPFLLGRLYTEPRERCECGGRVFELLTHRDCGSAFLRGYARDAEGDFLWHEPTSELGVDESKHLVELHLLVESKPHKDVDHKDARPIWVDILSGRMVHEEPIDLSKFLPAYVCVGSPSLDAGHPLLSFRRCPICLRRWPDGRTKIMDLATKGEAPFANLVRTQLVMQSPAKKQALPNLGRKVLLFSDGRQKAARLARDIPREVGQDSFRQAIALAAARLEQVNGEALITEQLYKSFVTVAGDFNLRLFDGDDQTRLYGHVSEACDPDRYDGLLDLLMNWTPKAPPRRYEVELLRQLCSPYYSFSAATLGYVVPRKKPFESLLKSFSEFSREDLYCVTVAWMADLLSEFALIKELSTTIRRQAAGYHRKKWGSDGALGSGLREALRHMDSATLSRLESELKSKFCSGQDKEWFVNPNQIALKVDPDCYWYHCSSCTLLSPVVVRGRCPNCGDDHVERLDPATSEYIRARKGFWREPVIAALKGASAPIHVTAEEHTAQLSQRDASAVQATTEKFELRFQDVVLDESQGPIDVLSCTTTMEVGVDIGSLVAVGLRNVPPQRENYQQRAGRAGRRGSAVSTVVTYAQGGPHDGHYFRHPKEMVAGSPREPLLKTDNAKIARRHVHAYLIQTFFHEAQDNGEVIDNGSSAALYKALGSTQRFLWGPASDPLSLVTFSAWVQRRMLSPGADLIKSITTWLPSNITSSPDVWIRQVAIDLVGRLLDLAKELSRGDFDDDTVREDNDSEEDTAEVAPQSGLTSDLLEFLFNHGILPSYAFPTDLVSFVVEKYNQAGKYPPVLIKERPQQSILKALSEYAPGRLIVINKETYRSGGVAANCLPSEIDRAVPLFKGGMATYTFCTRCSYVREASLAATDAECPVCDGELHEAEMLIPEVFYPEGAEPLDEYDRDQEVTFATSAQYPVPLGEEELEDWKPLGVNGLYTHALDRPLVVANKGKKAEDAGFLVCEKCGAASPADEANISGGRHKRPYLLGGKHGDCNGTFRSVFLGAQFKSDLLLLRIVLKAPAVTDMTTSAVRGTLSDGLRTLAEAVVLAASYCLDVDPAEFSAGYRIIPTDDLQELRADLYLFDTLAGGAGYSDQAGEIIDQILDETERRLRECDCNPSCTNCLRHYGNQYWHGNLDRHLGLALLRYMRHGEFPSLNDLLGQHNHMIRLQRMLELDGLKCKPNAVVNGCTIPLLVEDNGRKLALGTHSGLLDRTYVQSAHPLKDVLNGRGIRLQLLNEFLLDRNPPVAYQLVKQALDE